jgi:hypothetical protein
MQLNDANLEKHGWMFSPSLRLLVREHEAGHGKWDVEMDSYTNRNTLEEPVWDNDQEVFDAADTVKDLVAAHPELAIRDWVDGDKIKFF